MSPLHVVFGTGPLGLAVMRALRLRGLRVRMINRSSRVHFPKDQATEVGGIDAADPRQTREVCEGAAVVYHCVGLPYTRWEAELPAIGQGILQGAAHARARLVYGDNLYAYGRIPGLIHEGQAENPQTRKGALRSRIARTLLDAHHAGSLQVCVARASDFYGPWVTHSRLGERVFAHALAGRVAYLVGDIDCLHTYTYVDDFAEALITLGERDEAPGRVWIIPSAPTVTTRAIVELIFRSLQARTKLRSMPSWLFAIAGIFDANLRELAETMHQFQNDFVADHSRFAQVFGAHVTPHEEAIARTLDWYRSERPPEQPTRFRRSSVA